MRSRDDAEQSVNSDDRYRSASLAAEAAEARANGLTGSRARTLTDEIHSASSRFDGTISTSGPVRERSTQSRLRVECATLEAARHTGSGHVRHRVRRASVEPAPTLTIEIHSAPSEFRGKISTPRSGTGLSPIYRWSIADFRAPLECASVRMSGGRPEAPAGQASHTTGRRHSPFKSTAFFVVADPGCPHLASRLRYMPPLSPVECTAFRVIGKPGYPQPKPRRHSAPAYWQWRFMRLPPTRLKCRKAP